MKEVKQPRKPLIFYYVIVMIVMMLLNSLLFPRLMKQKVENVDYGTFLNMVSRKEVAMVQIEGDYIFFVDKQEEPAFTGPRPSTTPIWLTGSRSRAVPSEEWLRRRCLRF